MEAQVNKSVVKYVVKYVVKSGNKFVMTNGNDLFLLPETTKTSGDIKVFETHFKKMAADVATLFGGEIVRR